MHGGVLVDERIATLRKRERNCAAMFGTPHGQKLASQLIGAVCFHLQWTRGILSSILFAALVEKTCASFEIFRALSDLSSAVSFSKFSFESLIMLSSVASTDWAYAGATAQSAINKIRPLLNAASYALTDLGYTAAQAGKGRRTLAAPASQATSAAR